MNKAEDGSKKDTTVRLTSKVLLKFSRDLRKLVWKPCKFKEMVLFSVELLLGLSSMDMKLMDLCSQFIKVVKDTTSGSPILTILTMG